MQPSLLANLDEHTDWVNKIIYIESVNTLLSCSNDTTVKVWRLNTNPEYEVLNRDLKNAGNLQQTYRQGSISTLQEHTDYIRTMDYSKNLGRLFTASDDGKIMLFDLHVEKIMSKYSNFDETGNFGGLVLDSKARKRLEDE